MKRESSSPSKKMLIIHRALAPYRIDLFNALYQRYQCDLYFEEGEAENHRFDYSLLERRLRFPYQYLSPGALGIKNLRWDILKLIARGHYDLIITSEINLTTLLALAARSARSRHSRIISIVDDSHDIAQRVAKGKWGYKKLLLRSGMLDGVIFCDQRAEKVYAEQLGHADRYHTLPILQEEEKIRRQLPPLYPKAAALRQLYTSKPTDKILLYVGRLSPEKNLERLITAFSNAFAESQEIRLVLVGDGPLEEALHTQARQSPCPERIHFAGRKEGDELYTHYLMADAFVLASTLERFGAVANEALLVGLPSAISSATGIASMLQRGESISLFVPHSTEQIEQALRTTLEGINTPWQADRPSLMPQTFGQSLESLFSFLER